jgi:hypothetical protein
VKLLLALWLFGSVAAQVPATAIIKGTALSSSGSLVVVQIPSSEVDLQWNLGTVTGSPSLAFTIQPVDPLNTGTSVGSSCASVSGLGAAGTGEITCFPLQSSAVAVQWSISGGSFASAYVTLSIKNPLVTTTGG